MKRATLPALLRDSMLSRETLESLQAEPWRFGFLSLLRRIGANPEIDSIGMARRPGAEPFRLGQQPSLAFAPREVASAEQTDGRLKLRLFSLGMLGPNGPLPIHFTEIAKDREDSRRDTTTVDFFDIFHHRYFTLFYRAWASAQSTAGLDRKHDERFSFYIASLAGLDVGEITQRALPSHACLAASAHLIRESRNPDGLRATLERYFGVPVGIDENVFHWIAIDPDDCGRMGRPGAAATMGQGAILGRVAPDRQHRFRIVLGPLDLDAYLRFTPQGEDLPQLVEWVRTFVGYELEWELELRIKPESAPPAVMGGQQRMGWSGWLGRPDQRKPVTGMRFEPERYARHFNRRPTRPLN
ncbi:type VI secretion system baseplate subunit TssG [Burkholderia cenocepacia]|uniref:type VI secretion system baseplate subunit TssG n=1 Tax=Burkholderia cenocepacia TaxID=95486 RepID=UPI001F456CC8|nr:type VI secretion system baseplate subunit TssG [Burkholderia cenocepacia]ELK7720601.1 type VI secretion system baseplate subunit TssG [Burkholderia cenocepacia]MCF1369986.1 type VI secretion system baseplate subunit TssG [Burkholderia cenocepacia]MCF1385983.1 type VI secretion system baseplate subunit TssG [Burkholderia cenocepacia]MDR8029435.1 type VI secretion system baseplate subunit TssG [Burkholderia cenocepacia]MDR8039901.1 type VI secretion system baseplate subunit TssG [Burkholderi